VEGVLVYRRGRRHAVRAGRRHAGAGGEYDIPGRLYVWLSFTAAPGRGQPRRDFQVVALLGQLRLFERAQPPAHALCLAEPVLGWLRRSLRPPVLDGRLAGRPDLLASETA